MKPFDFYNPTRIIFGNGTFARLGAETAKYGKKALLVKAAGPLEKMGVYSRAAKLLADAGVQVVALEGVSANPKLSSVREGIKLCQQNRLEAVVAVGGGSAIDCAKAIAVGAVDEGDVWDFFTGKRAAGKALPIGAVSTLAATGAEMSMHCVITNEAEKKKYATHFEVNYPRFSIIDPELHKSVPRFLTACGLCDTITHAGENYFIGDRNTPMTDRIAEGVILTVLENDRVRRTAGEPGAARQPRLGRGHRHQRPDRLRARRLLLRGPHHRARRERPLRRGPWRGAECDSPRLVELPVRAGPGPLRPLRGADLRPQGQVRQGGGAGGDRRSEGQVRRLGSAGDPRGAEGPHRPGLPSRRSPPTAWWIRTPGSRTRRSSWTSWAAAGRDAGRMSVIAILLDQVHRSCESAENRRRLALWESRPFPIRGENQWHGVPAYDTDSGRPMPVTAECLDKIWEPVLGLQMGRYFTEPDDFLEDI